MELLFNKDNNGQEELTEILGFLSSDFSYERLKTDIELNTPDLAVFISSEVYNKIVEFYVNDSPKDWQIEKFSHILKLSQLYISLMAYLDFAPNHDLMHTTAGRKMNKAEDETTPWDWQIDKDNAALRKRAYKALDQLIDLLTKNNITKWLKSEAYTKASNLFVKNTTLFNKRYSINNSAQLFFRLIPLMEEIEIDEIIPRLSAELITKIKKENNLTPEENQLKLNIEKAIVYLSLAKAYATFNIEMFSDKVSYNPRSKSNTESMIREASVIQHKKDAQKHLSRIEDIVKKLKQEDTQPQDLLQGLKENTKHVDL